MNLDIITLALPIGIVGLIAAFLQYRGVMAQSPGSALMQDLAEEIHKGAMAFLKREYLVVLPFLAAVAQTW